MKLTKIKIINWMYIDNTTIDINNNAVLIGQNGSGKTTIIDAIQYAITGSKGDSKFNSAQGSSTRNLESYVRGTIGSREKEHLRPNDTISYVLIQLEDNENTHVFGVALEYTTKLSENRFYFRNQDIEEHLFLDGKDKYKDFKKFRDQFDKEDFESFPSRGPYQNRLRDIMGLLPSSNYFKLLGKALQLKSLDNINNFISEFLLEIDELDISSLQDVISNIKRVRMSIEQNREKAELLRDINDLGDILLDLIDKNETNKNKLIIAKEKLLLSEIRDAENELAKSRNKKIGLESNEQELIRKRNEIDNNISLINKKIDNTYPDFSKYKDEITMKADILRNNKMRIKSLDEDFKGDINYFNTYELKNEEDKQIRSVLNKLYKNKYKLSSNTLGNDFDHFSKMVITRKLNLEYQIDKTKIKEKEQIKTLKYNEAELKKLKSGIQTYPSNTTLLIKRIEEDLFDYYNEEIEVGVLSQYLEINNDKYRNAIEGYLGNNRFNILVEPKYYNDALKTYHRYSNEIYGVNLIDTTKIKTSELIEGTLSEFVISNNKHALNYVNSLLNRVTYVSNIDDLNKFKSSITEDCMLYSNHLVRKINPEIYQKQYIGQEALKRNIEGQELLVKENSNELKLTIDEIKELNNLIDLYSNLNITKYNSLNLNVYGETTIIEKELEDLNNIMSKIEKDDEYIMLADESNKLLVSKNENIRKLDNNNALKAKIDIDIAGLRDAISQKKDKVLQLKEDIEIIDIVDVNLIRDSLDKTKITNRYLDDLEKEINKTEAEKYSKNFQLVSMMKDYIYKFSEKFIPDLSDISKYKKAYNDINKIQFDLEAKLASFEVSLSQIITSDFISKINTNIHKIDNTIKNINQKLRQSVFGEDSTYRVISEPSDDPKFNKLYEIAKRNDVRNKNLLNLEQVDKDNKDIEIILNEYNNEKLNLDINDILDVRNYFKFDVVVKSKDHTKYLSEVMQTQSGGEIQTPFYILITAAFEQTKDPRRKDESFNLVLFDEAFSNMDPQRISEMLKYYEKFNIQTIISVPSKLESLGGYVNTALGVYRKGETTHVLQIEKNFRT